jgi:hypothetical protein
MPAQWFGRSSRANVITELLSTSLPRTLAMARSSHDHADLMVVVDGRVELVEEVYSGGGRRSQFPCHGRRFSGFTHFRRLGFQQRS